MSDMIYEWAITHEFMIAVIFFILGSISEIHYRYSHYRINNLLHEYRQDYIKIECYKK